MDDARRSALMEILGIEREKAVARIACATEALARDPRNQCARDCLRIAGAQKRFTRRVRVGHEKKAEG